MSKDLFFFITAEYYGKNLLIFLPPLVVHARNNALIVRKLFDRPRGILNLSQRRLNINEPG